MEKKITWAFESVEESYIGFYKFIPLFIINISSDYESHYYRLTYNGVYAYHTNGKLDKSLFEFDEYPELTSEPYTDLEKCKSIAETILEKWEVNNSLK